MSIEKVRQYFQPLGREQDILEFETSSATVELAAQAAGVIPARIAVASTSMRLSTPSKPTICAPRIRPFSGLYNVLTVMSVAPG